MANSLFHTKGAIPKGHLTYITRRSDLEADITISREEYLYTMAPRQMGKTSLLKRLAQLMETKGWQTCFIDLATLKGLSKKVWFEQLAQKIARNLNHSTHITVQNQSDFELFLFDQIGLSDYDRPIRLALFLDEVEGLLKLPFSDEFLMVLRDLYQHREDYPGKLVVAFAGAVDVNTLVSDQTISPFNIAEEIILEDFTQEESFELTNKLYLLNIPIDDQAHSTIYSWTFGHPYLTQRICSHLENLTQTNSIKKIGPEEINKTIQESIINPRKKDHNIKHVQSKLNNLRGLALTLWQKLLAGEKISATDPGFYALYLTGAVREDSQGNISIRNRIYENALYKPEAHNSLETDPNRLLAIIAGHFNSSELHTLCFELGVDCDVLEGNGKEAKARELIAYLQRRGRIPELIETIAGLRPRINI